MKQKIILITGANKGIGLEAARLLGTMGHFIIVTARDKQKGNIAVEKIRSLGAEAHFIQLDVNSDDQIKEAERQVEKLYGRVRCFD